VFSSAASGIHSAGLKKTALDVHQKTGSSLKSGDPLKLLEDTVKSKRVRLAQSVVSVDGKKGRVCMLLIRLGLGVSG